MAFGWLRRRTADQVRSLVGSEPSLLDDSANFFGVESRGAGQIRGNGCLAATGDELVFLMWLPRRELRISRSHITGTARVGSHLGKTVGRPLLLVRFTRDDGQPDSAAWLVRDLAMWEAVLA